MTKAIIEIFTLQKSIMEEVSFSKPLIQITVPIQVYKIKKLYKSLRFNGNKQREIASIEFCVNDMKHYLFC